MRKSIIWIPVLLMGAMLYWTLALGFGGLSLMTLTGDCVSSPEGSTRDSYQSITVNLGDSLDPGAQQAGSVTVDLVTDHDSAPGEESDPDQRGSGRRSRLDQGPGETAF